MTTVAVHRQNLHLRPNPSRVLVRPFLLTPESRVLKIVSRVLSLPEDEVGALLEGILREFSDRHLDIRQIFASRFAQIRPLIPSDRPLSEERRLLLGSYFTNEYSLESAALFNPSIVAHPDQNGVPADSLRVILSLRATGEGHISSITFRSGLVGPGGQIAIDEPAPCVTNPRPIPSAHYDRALFTRKLAELGLDATACDFVLGTLQDSFTLEELQNAVRLRQRDHPEATVTFQRMVLLAQSNYEVEFPQDQNISQRIIFPYSPSETNGIEDARFVRFVDDSGRVTFYATYTAYDGRVILPQLLETTDFVRFRICTLNGPAVQNKGMALFPRKCNGLYAMLSRQDSENIHLMFSDDLHFWYESRVIMRPSEAWELIQLGNCGSPIETEAGWLVLTHGVGAMRKYCIGAILLDRDDPSRLIGRLRQPLLTPEGHEREGYVPNVVYTCGALVHQENLILPYAVSDSATSFAHVPLADLLQALTE